MPTNATAQQPVVRMYRHAYVTAKEGQLTVGKVPRRCWADRWHIWRWVSTSTDQQERPPRGLQCACGKRTAE